MDSTNPINSIGYKKLFIFLLIYVINYSELKER
jgi:hypothetical protein